MARYTGPLTKIARRFREPLFGSSKALERKNYGPGQHGKGGKNRKSKQSEYAVQLAEKQKAKYIYGLLERQFSNTFSKASRMKGNTGENLLFLLESRLDNVVYRLGFSPTRRAARQLVSHKHVEVNGHVVNIASYQVRPGDILTIRETSIMRQQIQENLSARAAKFPWVDVDKQKLTGRFLHLPERTDIPENIKERLIVELYSR
jgi:small subunit ribosomal protein S4